MPDTQVLSINEHVGNTIKATLKKLLYSGRNDKALVATIQTELDKKEDKADVNVLCEALSNVKHFTHQVKTRDELDAWDKIADLPDNLFILWKKQTGLYATPATLERMIDVFKPKEKMTKDKKSIDEYTDELKQARIGSSSYFDTHKVAEVVKIRWRDIMSRGAFLVRRAVGALPDNFPLTFTTAQEFQDELKADGVYDDDELMDFDNAVRWIKEVDSCDAVDNAEAIAKKGDKRFPNNLVVVGSTMHRGKELHCTTFFFVDRLIRTLNTPYARGYRNHRMDMMQKLMEGDDETLDQLQEHVAAMQEPESVMSTTQRKKNAEYDLKSQPVASVYLADITNDNRYAKYGYTERSLAERTNDKKYNANHNIRLQLTCADAAGVGLALKKFMAAHEWYTDDAKEHFEVDAVHKYFGLPNKSALEAVAYLLVQTFPNLVQAMVFDPMDDKKARRVLPENLDPVDIPEAAIRELRAFYQPTKRRNRKDDDARSAALRSELMALKKSKYDAMQLLLKREPEELKTYMEFMNSTV